MINLNEFHKMLIGCCAFMLYEQCRSTQIYFSMDRGSFAIAIFITQKKDFLALDVDCYPFWLFIPSNSLNISRFVFWVLLSGG